MKPKCTNLLAIALSILLLQGCTARPYSRFKRSLVSDDNGQALNLDRVRKMALEAPDFHKYIEKIYPFTKMQYQYGGKAYRIDQYFETDKRGEYCEGLQDDIAVFKIYCCVHAGRLYEWHSDNALNTFFVCERQGQVEGVLWIMDSATTTPHGVEQSLCYADRAGFEGLLRWNSAYAGKDGWLRIEKIQDYFRTRRGTRVWASLNLENETDGPLTIDMRNPRIRIDGRSYSVDYCQQRNDCLEKGMDWKDASPDFSPGTREMVVVVPPGGRFSGEFSFLILGLRYKNGTDLSGAEFEVAGHTFSGFKKAGDYRETRKPIRCDS